MDGKCQIVKEINFKFSDANIYRNAIQSYIDKCNQICSDQGRRIEWGIERTIEEYDGITRFEGWFKIIDEQSGQTLIIFNNFNCAIPTYMLLLRDINSDFIFQGCLSRKILSFIGVP